MQSERAVSGEVLRDKEVIKREMRQLGKMGAGVERRNLPEPLSTGILLARRKKEDGAWDEWGGDAHVKNSNVMISRSDSRRIKSNTATRMDYLLKKKEIPDGTSKSQRENLYASDSSVAAITHLRG